MCADALEYAYEPFDVAICFLVLMFLPAGARRDYVRRLCSNVRPGGALIVFDKTDSAAGGYLGTAIHRLTLAGKLAGHASPEAILAKELSISGPLPWQFMHMTVRAPVEVFRFGEFAGWVIEAPE
ncbi:class I SAM-dependent methyltransferase [Paraburkholderia heleia]|uniref:class I SAM-dependent methyltransferase n=1 Tax=Paraburkholderia heleia TaxID=634127 RepID=UPI002AB6E848|nr:class I SAM-dependent methyltransferase [Paraburkholderia heleia]